MINLPKSISAIVLLAMSVILYDRHINWRKLKETKPYLIKSIIAVVLAVLLNSLISFLYSTAISRDFIEISDFIIAIVVGLIWYKEYKKIKKKIPPKTKPITLKVNFKDGRWECPACGKSNSEKFNFCDDCGQEIEKKI